MRTPIDAAIYALQFYDPSKEQDWYGAISGVVEALDLSPPDAERFSLAIRMMKRDWPLNKAFVDSIVQHFRQTDEGKRFTEVFNYSP